jgi:hypothetical protein
MTLFYKNCKNTCLLFFLINRLRNINTSQRILNFEVSIILFCFSKTEKETHGRAWRVRIFVSLTRGAQRWCAPRLSGDQNYATPPPLLVVAHPILVRHGWVPCTPVWGALQLREATQLKDRCGKLLFELCHT